MTNPEDLRTNLVRVLLEDLTLALENRGLSQTRDRWLVLAAAAAEAGEVFLASLNATADEVEQAENTVAEVAWNDLGMDGWVADAILEARKTEGGTTR